LKPAVQRLSQHGQQPSKGFDCILGNPPFLNQLESGTARARQTAALVGATYDGARKSYTDASALFLLLSDRITRSGGRYSLVQPQSVLAAADAKAVRDAMLTDGSLAALWVSNEHVFAEATVYTCAITIEKGGARQRAVQRSHSRAFMPLDQTEIDSDALIAEETWSHLTAEASGIPSPAMQTEGCIGDLAVVTADFRDQYYGLDGFLIEHAECSGARAGPDFERRFPPIVTTGAIDLACCKWGASPMRILKNKWQAPRVDRTRMEREGTLSLWMTQRLVPKVLVATQTKVIEVFADDAGRFLPSVPVLSVVPNDPTDTLLLAAALAAPPISALAMTKYSGAALSADAIKLSARQAAALPLPADRAAWKHAAAAFSEAQLQTEGAARLERLSAFGAAACDAYGVQPAGRAALLKWWTGRLGLDLSEDGGADE
jgi:hypothetical protein